jgi:hypothetical protein
MPQVNFAAVPSGVTVSEGRINELSAAATETGAAFARKIESLTGTYAEARDRYSRDADALVESAPDPESRIQARQLAKRRMAQQVVSFRRTLIESSASDRSAILNRLKALADEAEAISAVCASPAQMLGRVALGEGRKTQLIHQLEEAGPTEIETAARIAIMSGDIVLAAAIAVVVDRRPRDRRPFPVADFAQRVMGSVFDDADRKLQGVLLAYRSAQAADLEFNRGAPDPLVNMSLALARRKASDTEPAEAGSAA